MLSRVEYVTSFINPMPIPLRQLDASEKQTTS